METRNSKKYKTVKITDAFQSVKPKRTSWKRTVKPGKSEVRSTSTSTEDFDENRRIAELNRLRHFDMDWEFGPCIGITRLERWERAKKLGLDPPMDVKNMILRHRDDENYLLCVWSYYKVL